MSIAGGKILDGFIAFQDPAAAKQLDPKPLTGSSELSKFGEAMQRANASHAVPIANPHAAQAAHAATAQVRVAANEPAAKVDVVRSPTTPSPTAPTQTADVGAADRARKTLQLDRPEAPAKPSETGDRILDGLQKLRGVFDNQQSKINTMLQEPVGDASKLMALQVEVVNFSLLVDVSSKLTGKSTQALETLLKGQ